MPITINRNLRPGTTGSVRGARIKPVTLDALHEQLQAMTVGNHDVKIKGREMRFENDGTITIQGRKYTWNDWSFSQFCAKLKIPTEFIRRCPNGEGPSGRAAIVNYWKEPTDAKPFFLRLKDSATVDSATGAVGYVRAVLTDRYDNLDNLELVTMISPFITKHNLSLQLGQATDKALHMRLLFPETIDVPSPVEGGEPDVHQAGIHVTNSEVAYTSLQGDFLLYRQVCSNGLMAVFDNQPLFKQRHMNIDRHEMRMTVKSALEQVGERRGEVIHKVERSISQVISSPTRELKRVLKGGRASDDFIEMAIDAYEKEPVASRFGLTQAITLAAQRLPIDQRVQMENLAGSYLMAA